MQKIKKVFINIQKSIYVWSSIKALVNRKANFPPLWKRIRNRKGQNDFFCLQRCFTCMNILFKGKKKKCWTLYRYIKSELKIFGFRLWETRMEPSWLPINGSRPALYMASPRKSRKTSVISRYVVFHISQMLLRLLNGFITSILILIKFQQSSDSQVHRMTCVAGCINYQRPVFFAFDIKVSG